jgi:hypothetical protein
MTNIDEVFMAGSRPTLSDEEKAQKIEKKNMALIEGYINGDARFKVKLLAELSGKPEAEVEKLKEVMVKMLENIINERKQPGAPWKALNAKYDKLREAYVEFGKPELTAALMIEKQAAKANEIKPIKLYTHSAPGRLENPPEEKRPFFKKK